jgi:hypothetical protein
MKKIIIVILAIIVIAAVYFLFIADREEAEKSPVVNEVEEPSSGSIELPVYPDAEFIMQEAPTTHYYAVDASLLEVVDFYKEEFPNFDIEEDPIFGYALYNSEMLEFSQSELRSGEELMAWTEQNRGLVIWVHVFSYDPSLDEYYILEDYKEELEGKTVIEIGHF